MLVVVVYHHSPTAMRGGYLGVSTFFVLSGYLIGSLCFSEVASTGRLRAGRFWSAGFDGDARRGRRCSGSS